MNDFITLSIEPLNRQIKIHKGANLLDAFLSEGIEIPVLCNRNGSCGKCMVILKADANPVTRLEMSSIGETLIKEGYRLACRTEVYGSGKVIIPMQNEEELLENTYIGNELSVINSRPFTLSRNLPTYSVAIDIGTTTLTGYMFDKEGNLLSYCSFFNPTTLYGYDVITRMTYFQNREEEFQRIRLILLSGIKRLLSILYFRAVGKSQDFAPIDIENIGKVAVCGNTIMQHIFIGINPVGIGLFPYEPVVSHLVKIKVSDLRDFNVIGLNEDAEIVVAPSVSGFIGGDAVCGILATQLHKASEPCLLIDLGTNGEMVVSHEGNLFAASASAGPAFEGYKISCGMRATVGAIDAVSIEGQSIRYSVIGGARPRGICGTGALSAVSTMLKAGILSEKGHIIASSMTNRIKQRSLIIATESETSTGMPVVLTDKDIEVIQQAKAAFASGITCLLKVAQLEPSKLKRIFVAGAFGSGADIDSLKTTGLIPYNIEAEIVPFGNAAGAGAVMLLLSEDAEKEVEYLRDVIKTVEFASTTEFEDAFLEAMFFKRNAS